MPRRTSISKQRERERVLRERVRETRPAGRLREPGRRPGRTGVRRQLLRDGCHGRAGAARAGLRGSAVPACEFARATAQRWRRCRRAVAPSSATRRACTRAGAGRARLRRQAPLSRRGHRPVGRRRFGADAGDRRGCARRGARAGGDDALALHLADEPRGRGRAGRALGVRYSSISDRGHVRGDAGRAARTSSPAARPIPPRRTSRRAAAACC